MEHNPQTFPVQGRDHHDNPVRLAVPFAVVIRHQSQAIRNHGQTVHRLAERGGLCWTELLAVLADVPYQQVAAMTEPRARHAAMKIVEREELTINNQDHSHES